MFSVLSKQAPTRSVCRAMVNRAMSWQPTRLPSSRGSKQSATVKINGLLHTKDEVQVRLWLVVSALVCSIDSLPGLLVLVLYTSDRHCCSTLVI